MFPRTLCLFLVCFWFRDCIIDLLTPEVTILNFCYSLPYRQAEKKTGYGERLLVTQSSCLLPSFLLHKPISFSALRRKIDTRATVVFITWQNKPRNTYGVIVTCMGVQTYFLLDMISVSPFFFLSVQNHSTHWLELFPQRLCSLRKSQKTNLKQDFSYANDLLAPFFLAAYYHWQQRFLKHFVWDRICVRD